MSDIVLIDGFDLYNGTGANTGLQSKWSLSGSNVSLVTGRFGGQCLRIGSITGSSSPPASRVLRVFPGDYGLFGVNFALKVTSLSSLSDTATSRIFMVFLAPTGATQLGVAITPAGALSVYRLTGANAGTLLGSTDIGKITESTFHYVELSFVISDTVGEAHVKVDGNNELSLSGVDTRNGTPTTVDRIQIQAPYQTVNNSVGIHVDDLYVVNDAVFIGEAMVETSRPNGDTSYKAFVPSSGSSNYAMVDDTTSNGDTDYVQGSVVGDLDLYSHPALSSVPTSIFAVQVTAFARKTDASTRAIALSILSGATSSDGPDFYLAADYGKFDRIIQSNPDTSTDWSASEVNSLVFGEKVTV